MAGREASYTITKKNHPRRKHNTGGGYWMEKGTWEREKAVHSPKGEKTTTLKYNSHPGSCPPAGFKSTWGRGGSVLQF